MAAADYDHHGHAHGYAASERATAWVLGLTLVTMAVEIVAGWWTGSMALLADGWHMGTHAAAMGVALVAYRFMRRHAHSGRYANGGAKAAELGGFANAVMLVVVAVLIAGESVARLVSPAAIDFSAALGVAAAGLAVNLVSAWLLREEPHAHAGEQAGGHDHNREAALVHVLSDALTSALAIVALWGGARYGWMWLDPLTGLIGAAIILRWSASLLRRTGAVLLDAQESPPPR